jgi:hypothetical protein
MVQTPRFSKKKKIEKKKIKNLTRKKFLKKENASSVNVVWICQKSVVLRLV